MNLYEFGSLTVLCRGTYISATLCPFTRIAFQLKKTLFSLLFHTRLGLSVGLIRVSLTKQHRFPSKALCAKKKPKIRKILFLIIGVIRRVRHILSRKIDLREHCVFNTQREKRTRAAD